MAEFVDVLRQFDRMCWYYQRKRECPMGCPMNGVNISQCRKIAFECPESVEKTVMSWAAEHPEPVYELWGEWFEKRGDLIRGWHNATNIQWIAKTFGRLMCTPIPADIAEKLGIEPKEG